MCWQGLRYLHCLISSSFLNAGWMVILWFALTCFYFIPGFWFDWFVPLLFFVAPVSAPACTVDGTVVYVRTWHVCLPAPVCCAPSVIPARTSLPACPICCAAGTPLRCSSPSCTRPSRTRASQQRSSASTDCGPCTPSVMASPMQCVMTPFSQSWGCGASSGQSTATPATR